MSLRIRRQAFQKLLQREWGQTIIEYALILVLFSVALIGAQLFFRGGIEGYYKVLTDTIASLV